MSDGLIVAEVDGTGFADLTGGQDRILQGHPKGCKSFLDFFNRLRTEVANVKQIRLGVSHEQ